MICLYVAAADSTTESAIAGLISDCVEVEWSGFCLYGAEDIVAITGAEDIGSITGAQDIRAITGAEDIEVEVVEVVVVAEQSGADSKVVERSGF